MGGVSCAEIFEDEEYYFEVDITRISVLKIDTGKISLIYLSTFSGLIMKNVENVLISF